MKKALLLSGLTLLTTSTFAFDTDSKIQPKGTIADYTKTEYTITQKFGDYYRAPKSKFVHTYDNNGREVEACEYTNKDSLVDKLVYTYDDGGNLMTITCLDNDQRILWKIDSAYDENGNKIEESEYNVSEQLVNKTIWKTINPKQTEESYYDADGNLLERIITKLDDKARISEVNQYNPEGALEEKKVFTYNDADKLSEIIYFNVNGAMTKRNVYRFDSSYTITELQTYNKDNKLSERIIYKYDDKGNTIKITTYSVVDKFGSTLNELTGICEYSYTYGAGKPYTPSLPVTETAQQTSEQKEGPASTN